MKKIILLLLMTNFCLAQGGIQVVLLNYNIGVPISSNNNIIITNDNNLNIIFNNHNVNTFFSKGGYPMPNLALNVYHLECINCNYTNLKNDLISYNTVIQKAQFDTVNYFSDALLTTLTSNTIGIPTGVNANNIIVTNDNGLNLIFTTHNVKYYSQTYPSSTNSNSLKVYSIVCDCDANLLKIDLDNYNTIYDNVEFFGAVYLSNPIFKQIETNIYPNPFQDKITIETDLTIEKYSVFDLIGKKIIETETNDELNTELAKLNTGTYLLQLQQEDNNIVSKKIIKN
ncbi:T9SS type A sorting domain-containing protein [uncultured Flavobacterium sp.]|uniref:T9SS type A sorting domain-containing protein n=1 Tax=uncultured Flavobacterium sp. TaxID=165435 RepID=UPI0030ED20B4|tara:strand:- start:1997 stop:2851 length:855 start_codon:yes stop_codon:yes gene_type:complete